MLTIWGRKTSSNVQALMWGIGELALPYERHDVGHRHGGTDTPSFLAMNPNGTVPVLRDGEGEPLWETGAVLRYLAARYGSARRPDPAERPDSTLDPDAIAEAYLATLAQKRSAWAFEVAVRPWVEKF